ncbi:LysR substrate-binding domain-containing protein [Pusillimonas sp.]|uniref:LysR substrate-binding domain-containing protein n=1 Tax=Pusillimonas sp. TaxID=3040095 RepID=UPI0037CAF1F4
MSLPHLPLTALRAFETSARLLSFKNAAAELHVTPTAISHQIRQLEQYLGVELFVRMHRGLALTPAARACLPHIREGFASLRTAVDTVRRHRDTGLLSVSAPPSFAMSLLMPLTHDFLASHPDIDLRVTTRMREPAPDGANPQDEAHTFRLWAQESDIVIVLGKDGFGDLDVELLLPLTIELVCSPELLSAGGLKQIQDVDQFPWLHDERGSKYGGASFWSQWLTHVGHEPETRQQGTRFTHAALAIDAAVRGKGLLVTTPCLCRKELRNGDLASPFNHSIAIQNSYFVLSRDSRKPAVELFKRWLRSAVDANEITNGH